MAKVLHHDVTVPVDGNGNWVDSGRWREQGVIYWHLIEPREWSITDSARFDTERAAAERTRASAGVAGSPREVVAWITSVTEQLIADNGLDEESLRSSGLEETRFRMAMLGFDVCSMLALKGGRIAHFSA
jgi:hypothetical protein